MKKEKMRKQKVAKNDFTPEKLPHNRVEVFFDCLKQRYDVWFKLGAVCLLFMIPLFIVEVIKDASYIHLEAGGNATAENIFAFEETFALYNVLPFVIFGIGLSGIMKVIRQLVWGEPIFFWHTFLSGVKQNYITYLFVFLLYGFYRMLIIYVEGLIPINYVNRIPTALSLVVLLPAVMFLLTATTIYKEGMAKLFGNSFKFYIKSAPITLAFVIVLAASICINLIDLKVVKYILMAVFIIFLLPMYLIAWTLHAHSVFDKMVNINLYPDYVDKGVNRTKK